MRYGNPLAPKRATKFERIRQTGRLLRAEGGAAVGARALRRAADQLAPTGYGRLPVSRGHLFGAAEVAANGWVLPGPAPTVPSERLTVGWVFVPPRPGSGGHTTMFRLISALEQAGHRCVLYVLDRHGWELGQHERTIRRWWPWVEADVRDFAAGMEDSHAIFATAWETAYAVLASPAKGVRFYLVQDFEPSFYPAGSEALMAEATYRFGFHGVTAGRWPAGRLRDEYGMPADHFDFGCDLDRYWCDGAVEARSGICYYCRPRTPRRAYELAMVALDLFAARHPEVDIHLFGRAAGKLGFRATDHGVLTPEQLNALYNRCIAGLALAATNGSLVPHEMLAAGCIPVVNDGEQHRMVLDNPHVAYAPPTPFDLAEALSALVERPLAARTAAAAAAATSVQAASWGTAGQQVDRIVRRVVADPEAKRQPAAA
jgi:glycosyltransferase involved in cell wall biosynthesis